MGFVTGFCLNFKADCYSFLLSAKIHDKQMTFLKNDRKLSETLYERF